MKPNNKEILNQIEATLVRNLEGSLESLTN